MKLRPSLPLYGPSGLKTQGYLAPVTRRNRRRSLPLWAWFGFALAIALFLLSL